MDPIEHNGGANVTFNDDSENKDNGSEFSDNHMNNNHDSSPLGMIERNLKIPDSHTFSFDSLANLTKNDNYNNFPYIPRKQSLNNPFDKF
mmetsp:Transcript_7693/g.8774  ORF Transcript_7693/g.8774 Transcript_7693/m.8774 type:complete len:90 (+) Transcript_7693:694-963(+)